MIRISAPAAEISLIGTDAKNDAIVSIRPDWFDDGVGDITTRVPEIIYSRSMGDTYYIDHVAGGGFVRLREKYVHVAPTWDVVEPGRRIRYRVTVPGKCSFWAELRAEEDVVGMAWGFRNETGERIDDLMVQFCPCMSRCATFEDPNGERVWARRDGRFIRSSDSPAEQGSPISYPCPDDPADDVICLESADGEHVLGIGWDVRPQHFLSNSALSCIHTEPHLEPLEPGAEQEVHGSLYCMNGDRNDLLARFRADWR